MPHSPQDRERACHLPKPAAPVAGRRRIMATSLDHYRLLGRSGLRVSPLALGTMTFGTDWGWGRRRGRGTSHLRRLCGPGAANFIDTANRYTEGTAERFVGAFAKGRRDRLVIATKYTLPMRPGDPNSGGNHRKSMIRSVEDSLGRLGTDHVDLLYLHAWGRHHAGRGDPARDGRPRAGPARSSIAASRTCRPGRPRGCRPSRTCAAGRRWWRSR